MVVNRVETHRRHGCELFILPLFTHRGHGLVFFTQRSLALVSAAVHTSWLTKLGLVMKFVEIRVRTDPYWSVIFFRRMPAAAVESNAALYTTWDEEW